LEIEKGMKRGGEGGMETEIEVNKHNKTNTNVESSGMDMGRSFVLVVHVAVE
jgi:hypothetical protein